MEHQFALLSKAPFAATSYRQATPASNPLCPFVRPTRSGVLRSKPQQVERSAVAPLRRAARAITIRIAWEFDRPLRPPPCHFAPEKAKSVNRLLRALGSPGFSYALSAKVLDLLRQWLPYMG
jgi:hypothetical protein